MNETIKNLLERRSVRGYKEDLVPEEVLNEILEAGDRQFGSCWHNRRQR